MIHKDNEIKFASNEWATRKILRGTIRFALLMIFCIAYSLLIGCTSENVTNQSSDYPSTPNINSSTRDKEISYMGNYIGISTYTGRNELSLSQVTVATGDKSNRYNFELGMDFGDAFISKLEINEGGQYFDVVYNNILEQGISDINTEIEITSIDRYSNRHEEMADDITHVKQKKLGDFLISVIQSKGINQIGNYEMIDSEDFYDIELISIIEDCALYSKKQDKFSWYLEINGLGVYNFDSLSYIDYEDTTGLRVITDKYGFQITSGTEDIEYTGSYEIEGVATVYDLNDSNSFMMNTGKGLYRVTSIDAKNTVDDLKQLFGVQNNV